MESSAPAWETHASLIIGIIALAIGVVTLPTVLQMFFGKPKIEFEFSTRREKGSARLICYIRNGGIRSRFLRTLGVTRTPVEISADFGIAEWNTGREIVHLERATITTERQSGLHVDLPFSITPARFPVVLHTDEEGPHVFKDDGNTTRQPLNAGTYVAHIDVITAHQDIRTVRRQFTVGVDPATTYWLPNR